MRVVIFLRLHKNVHDTVFAVLIDVDAVGGAGQLDLVLVGIDVQLLAGKAAVVHGAGEVGVQAALHPQHSVLLVAQLQAGDELVDLHHKIDLRLRVGAGGKLDALDHRANRHSAVALDKVLHLGQDHAQVAQLAGIDLACQNVGQLQGLVFCNLDLSHNNVHLFLFCLQ